MGSTSQGALDQLCVCAHVNMNSVYISVGHSLQEQASTSVWWYALHLFSIKGQKAHKLEHVCTAFHLALCVNKV